MYWVLAWFIGVSSGSIIYGVLVYHYDLYLSFQEIDSMV